MRRSVLPFASVHTNTRLNAGDAPSALSSCQHLQRRLQSFKPWYGASNSLDLKSFLLSCISVSLLISWWKIASLVSRHGLDVSAATDARDIFLVTLVISQHVDTKGYERVLSFSIRCRRHFCSPCLFCFFFHSFHAQAHQPRRMGDVDQS